jgi:hypothetical protein
MTSAPASDRLLPAIGLRLMSVGLFATMNACIKLAEAHGAALADGGAHPEGDQEQGERDPDGSHDTPPRADGYEATCETQPTSGYAPGMLPGG